MPGEGGGATLRPHRILTLTELEAAASLGLTRLLTLNGTRVAREEACILQLFLIFCVHLDECAGNGEAKSLALSCIAAAVKINLDIIFLSNLKQLQWLLNHILQDS